MRVFVVTCVLAMLLCGSAEARPRTFSTDYFRIEVDGRGNGTTLVAHGIGVDLPPAETVSALPKAEISENFIKFGPVRHVLCICTGSTIGPGSVDTERFPPG